MKKIICALFVLVCCCTYALARDDKGRGFTLGIETSLLHGIGDVELNGYSPVTMFAGYSLNKHLFIGGGFGFNKYYGTLLIPVKAKVRWTILKNMFSPYMSCDFGYNILGGTTKYDIVDGQTPPYNPDVRSGFLVKPELGLAIRTFKSSQFSLGVGFYNQKGKFSKDYIENGDMRSSTWLDESILTISLAYAYTF